MMEPFVEVKALYLEKSGKKLAVFSLVIFLLISAILIFSAYRINRTNTLDMIEESLEGIPPLAENYNNEWLMRSRVYSEDILTRAELGLKFYMEDETLTEAEKLGRVCRAASAESLSLLDGDKQILVTTGIVSPEESFRTCLQDLEPRTPDLAVFPAIAPDGSETGTLDGKGVVLLPLPGDPGRSLVFEFTCETAMELYNAFGNWSDLMEQVISGETASAYIKIGDKLFGYPLDEFTPQQTSQLFEELTEIFQNSDRFHPTDRGNSSKLITLMGERNLAVIMHYPQENADILAAVPLDRVIGTGIFSAASISAIICWGILLVQFYVARRILRETAKDEAVVLSGRWTRHASLPGILVVLLVTILFSPMLLMLENRANASFTAMRGRGHVQYAIDWQKEQEKEVRSAYSERYTVQSKLLAEFLRELPDYQTPEGLRELNALARSEYLMLFDSAGEELVSSNSYTGFLVGGNLSEEYRGVLLGYPNTVVGPQADPYNGRMQLGVATLMTDERGQPNGFLLAVYSAEELTAELKRLSYENTVNIFSVQKGHIIAAINDESGRFIAHTDPNMIGQKAASYMEGYESGVNYEGFSKYAEKSMYISARSAEGKTLLFMVPERENTLLEASALLTGVLVLLILLLVYYPVASQLMAQAMTESIRRLRNLGRPQSPMEIFPEGYLIFVSLLAVIALIASTNGWWPSFTYVFNRQWTKSFHLFSVWLALFITAVTLCCVFLVHTLLSYIERRINIRARTITRLVDSSITYCTVIFLTFYILDMFGVNTTALLASAGVITLAVGLGAKNLASDLLAGFFMVVDNTVHVGDYLSVAISNFFRINGYVTHMSIRTTEITDDAGNVTTLTNSQLVTFTNQTTTHPPMDAEKLEGKKPDTL